jgi:hypothetical protein
VSFGRVRPQRVIRYTDEALADGTIYRRYDDGRAEWRTRESPDLVRWKDNQGGEGTDERLADGMVKRTEASGQVSWGREQGYGRTGWYGGQVVTVNTTNFGGRVEKILAAGGLAALAVAVVAPPFSVDAATESRLRSRRHTARADAGDDEEADDFGDDELDDDDFG